MVLMLISKLYRHGQLGVGIGLVGVGTSIFARRSRLIHQLYFDNNIFQKFLLIQ
jgi:hypothetical protein